MTPLAYYMPAEATSPAFAFAFAKGCGGEITDERELFPGRPVALFGSPPMWPVLRQAQAEGLDWYYGDHGYFGDVRNLRKKYVRITKNAYQHSGRGPGSAARFAALGRPVQPWRTTGRHIVVCPNSQTYFGLHGLNVHEWLADVRTQLDAVTDREVRVRWKVTRTPIAEDLVQAWAVVVYSSSAAIDALIAGVPVCTLASFASTARMGITELTAIEQPIYPDDREPFLWALAGQQWTLPELYAGEAWRVLRAHA